MAEVKILYNGYQTIIQYQSNEKLKEIFKRFKIKINAENKELVYLYNGEIIKDDNIIIVFDGVIEPPFLDFQKYLF